MCEREREREREGLRRIERDKGLRVCVCVRLCLCDCVKERNGISAGERMFVRQFVLVLTSYASLFLNLCFTVIFFF